MEAAATETSLHDSKEEAAFADPFDTTASDADEDLFDP